jgi:ABC-2 type transport system permease protein
MTAMRYVATVAWREVIDAWRDRRLLLLRALWLALFGTAAYGSATATQALERDRVSADARLRAGWLEQGDKNPHGAAHGGLYAVKPVQSLAAFDRGVEETGGTLFPMTAHGRQVVTGASSLDGAPAQLLGTLTPARILQLLMPFAIIALGFAGVAGERNNGTMALTLSQGISPRQYVVGKAVGLGSAVGAALLPALALCWLFIGADTAGATYPDALTRLATLGVAYLAYAVIWIGIVIGVSARAATPAAALTRLLVAWGFFCVAVPSGGSALSERAVGVSTRYGLYDRASAVMSAGPNGHDPRGPVIDSIRTATLAAYGVSRVEDLPVNLDGIIMQADEEYGTAVYGKLHEEVAAGYARQDRLLATFGVVAPLLPLRQISMAAAGTDVAHVMHFERSAEAYRFEAVRLLNDDMTRNSKTGDWSYRAGRDLWERTATFTYATPALADVSDGVASSFLLLAVWLIAAIAYAMRLPVGNRSA